MKENITKYEHKKSENEMAKTELHLLEETDVVYKLVGPVLVKEDHDVAQLTIDKRLGFINGEM